MELEFSSLEQLYDRLKPALRTKASEFKTYGYEYLRTDDIWNYLKEKVWKNSHGLSLNEMVSDILSSSIEDIDDYFKEKLGNKNRKVYFNDN